jgi:hypothetical protein
MKQLLRLFAVVLACTALSLPHTAASQVSDETLKSFSTPDKVETGLGTLEFKDGAPTTETVQKVYDSLDYVRGVDAFINSFSGASAYAIREGFHSIGAEDNTVVIFSGLMDSNSLFLTANADTIYTLAILDLRRVHWWLRCHRWRSEPSMTCGSAGSSMLALPAPTVAKGGSI